MALSRAIATRSATAAGAITSSTARRRCGSVTAAVAACGGTSPQARRPVAVGLGDAGANPVDDGDRAAIIDMLALLHTAIPTGIQVPTRPLELATRQVIDQALASLGIPWTGGPYAEPGRDLLARYERPLRQASRDSTACSTGSGRPAGPLSSRTASPTPATCCARGPDCAWSTGDMTALARPERDLWWVISGDQDAARYSRRTGRTVNQDALALYRLRWDLDDIAGFLSQIGPTGSLP
jgi:spectinomycin phosphotransferase